MRAAPTFSSRGWTLAVVCLATFMLMLDLSVVAVALPQIQTSLDTTFSGLQWVVDGYALSLAALLVTAGSLGDLRGRKRLFLAGFVVFTAASLACGLAGTIDVLVVSRGLQGVGAAMLFATGPALLGHEFHGKARGMAFGLFGASAGLAIALGPLIGGGLIAAASWRWIFFVNVPVGVLAIAATALRVRESRHRQARSIDWAGMITFTVGLSAVVFAIIRGNADGWTSPLLLGCYAVAAAMFAAFVVIEHRLGDHAMFDLKLFRNVTFVGMSLAVLFTNGAGLPSVFIETNYVQNVLGSSAWETGLQFLPLTLALFVFGAVGGALTNRVPFRILMGVACAAIGAGLLLTQLVAVGSTWTVLIPSMIVTGAGMGLFNPTRAALAISVTEPAKAGTASGINESFQQVGTAIGIAAVGALFEHRVTQEFVSSPAGRQLGDSASAVGEAISAGSIDPSTNLPGAARAAAHDAFIVGFHEAMIVCAVLAGVATLIAVFMLRTRDLHSTALSLVPPDLEDQPATAVREPVPVG